MSSNDWDMGNVLIAWSEIAIIMRDSLDAVARLARGFAPTKRIESAISTLPVVSSESMIESGIVVDINKAPEGAAYEFGSGLFATRGDRHKYPIDPRPDNPNHALIFEWVNEPAQVRRDAPHTSDGKVILRHVEHPGVVAKPYMAPAFDSETGDKMAQQIDDAIMRQFGIGQDVEVELRISLG